MVSATPFSYVVMVTVEAVVVMTVVLLMVFMATVSAMKVSSVFRLMLMFKKMMTITTMRSKRNRYRRRVRIKPGEYLWS